MGARGQNYGLESALLYARDPEGNIVPVKITPGDAVQVQPFQSVVIPSKFSPIEFLLASGSSSNVKTVTRSAYASSPDILSTITLRGVNPYRATIKVSISVKVSGGTGTFQVTEDGVNKGDEVTTTSTTYETVTVEYETSKQASAIIGIKMKNSNAAYATFAYISTVIMKDAYSKPVIIESQNWVNSKEDIVLDAKGFTQLSIAVTLDDTGTTSIELYFGEGDSNTNGGTTWYKSRSVLKNASGTTYMEHLDIGMRYVKLASSVNCNGVGVLSIKE